MGHWTGWPHYQVVTLQVDSLRTWCLPAKGRLPNPSSYPQWTGAHERWLNRAEATNSLPEELEDTRALHRMSVQRQKKKQLKDDQPDCGTILSTANCYDAWTNQNAEYEWLPDNSQRTL